MNRRPTTQRQLGWGRLVAGAALVLSRLAGVISGTPVFDAGLLVAGLVLAILGVVTLAATDSHRPVGRWWPALGGIETAMFGIVLAIGADEDVGYVLAIGLLMLVLAALRSQREHAAALVVAAFAELVRQVSALLGGATPELIESVLGLGVAAAMSTTISRLVDAARQSEVRAQVSADAATAALAEAERAAEQLDVMQGLVAASIGASEDEALQRMVSAVADHLEVPSVTAVLLDSDSRPSVAATTDTAIAARDDVVPVGGGTFRSGPLRRALAGQPTRATENELATQQREGLPAHGDVALHPLVRANGTVVGALVCGTPAGRRLRDTELRTLARFADQISVAIEAARSLDHEADLAARYRELDRLKTDFIAVTSHELRTPLTTILGAVELMQERGTSLDAQATASLVDAVVRQARRLSRLVDDLRTVSMVDAGRLHVHCDRVDVGPVVCDAVRSVPGAVTAVAIDPTVPPVLADAHRLEQVVANLVANGEQHGEGTVHLEVRPGANSTVRLRVWDDGPGIPPNRRDEVFERFVRLAATDAHQRGSGLGLAIARELVVAMGGDIEVVDHGRGSAIEVSLPAA